MHLTNEEDLAYRRALDWYYDTEVPIPLETQSVARRLRVGTEALATVLKDFFKQTESGWIHVRCDKEIAHFHEISKRNQANGMKGGRPKKSVLPEKDAEKTQSVSSGLPVGTQSEPTGKATNNQYPSTNQLEGKPSCRSAPCPYDAIINLYMECLPTLPRVLVSNDKRKRLIKKRWSWILTSTKSDGTRRAENEEQAMEWLRAYFDRVSTNQFLMGDNNRNWKADIDYLMEDRGLKAVIERTQ